MSWQHRSARGYHEWKIESRRQMAGREVWATATVSAASSDNDAPANWEVERDGSPVARGHSDTVRQAKKDAFRSLWKPRQARFARRVR